LTIATDARDPDLEVAALAELGLAAIERGDVRTGLDRLDEAMATATSGEADLPETIAEACCSLVAACELAGDAGRLAQWARIVDPLLARGAGLPSLAFCRTCNAEMLAATGRREESETELLASARSLAATGHRSRCVDPAVKLAEVRLLQGRFEEAAGLLEGRDGLPESTLPRADLALATGEPALAIAVLLRRLNRLHDDGLLAAPLLARLVEAELAQGDRTAASETADRLTTLAGDTGHPMIEAHDRLARARLSGLVEEAQVDLERAADLFGKLQMPVDEAVTRLLHAESLAPKNAEVAALEASRAFEALERLGAVRYADRAAKLVRDLGGPARTGPKDAGILTQRETEVLDLLGEGLTNAEIATRLYISTKTAGHHVSSILAKLQLRNRSEAAAFAHRSRA
jgi:DNA-binding CsgD family transcriptional regulator